MAYTLRNWMDDLVELTPLSLREDLEYEAEHLKSLRYAKCLPDFSIQGVRVQAHLFTHINMQIVQCLNDRRYYFFNIPEEPLCSLLVRICQEFSAGRYPKITHPQEIHNELSPLFDRQVMLKHVFKYPLIPDKYLKNHKNTGTYSFPVTKQSHRALDWTLLSYITWELAHPSVKEELFKAVEKGPLLCKSLSLEP